MATGDLLADNAGAVVAVSPDTAGYVLTDNGPGNLPSYQPVGGAGTLTLLTADPASPVDDTWWAVRTGSSPTTVSIKVRISGTTYVIASMEEF